MAEPANGSRITAVMLLQRMDEHREQARGQLADLAKEMRDGFAAIERRLAQLPCEHMQNRIVETQADVARLSRQQAKDQEAFGAVLGQKAGRVDVEQLRSDMRRYAKLLAVVTLLALVLILGADPAKLAAVLKLLGMI